MRTRGVAVLLLLAASAAAAWLLHRESRNPSVDTVDVADPTPKEQGPAPSLAVPGARPTHDAPGPIGRLVGTVRRAGRPVAARVEVRWRASLEAFAQGHTVERTLADDLRPVRRNGPDAVGTAGSDGRYEIDAPTGRLDITAIAEAGARGNARANLPIVGQRLTADVDVAPACTLDGRARYADGRPFRGIVVVRPPDTYGPVLEEEAVAPGEDGRFHVGGLLEGPQHTRFIVPGEALYFVSGPVLPMSETWDVVVDENATTLDGRVVVAEGDVPIEGATVVVVSDVLTTRVRSGADGAFRATRRAGPTGYWLVASAEGFAPRSVDGNPASPVTVRLVRAASLAGTVRRANEGSPVPGARVRVVVADGERFANPLAEATTDAEGRYAIEGLVPGAVAVFASAPGLSMALSPQDWKSGWSTAAVVLLSGRRAERNVDLVASGVLVGRVLDAEGAPVEGAVVSVSSIEGETPRWVDPAFFDSSCVAADDGAFRLEGLAPGLLTTLTAGAPGYVTATGAPTLTTASPIAHVEIRFPPARHIGVVVLGSPDAAPIAGAAVQWLDGRPSSATTDAAGRVTIVGSTEGPASLWIRAAGYVSAHRLVPVAATSVEVRLERGLALTGRVVREDGSPAPHAHVWARPGGNDAPAFSTRAGGNGAFTLADVPDAELVVEALLTNPDRTHAQAKATGRPGTPLTIRLGSAAPDAGASVSRQTSSVLLLRVFDPAGRPVERADGIFRGRRFGTSGIQIRGGTTKHEMNSGETGTFEVWNARDGYGQSLGLAPGRLVVEAGATSVDLHLSPGAAVAGRVVDAEGRPIGLVSIEVVDAARAFRVARHSNAGSTEALTRARTDPDGGFRLEGLPHDADLRLIVRPPPGYARPDPIAVRSGDASVRVVLSAGVDATVHVVDAAGAAIDAAVVIEVVRDGSAVRVGTATDASGRAQIPFLDAGRPYRLSVFPQSRPDLLSRVVDPWAPADVTVVLREPVPLEGIVVGPDGAGIQARVFGRSPTDAGTWQAINCDVTGRFRSTAFGEGPVRIRVDADGFARREVVTVASADAPPLRIVLARGAVWRFAIKDWPAGRTGGAYLTDESGPPRETDAYGEIDGTGAFTVREADPSKRYRVWIPPEDGDGYALARDLEPSDELTHLAFARGGSIRGTVRLPEGIQNLECRATCDGLFAQGVATSDGAIEVRGIPPGRWTVTVRGRTDLCHWKGSAEASPGDDVRIVLEPTESD